MKKIICIVLALLLTISGLAAGYPSKNVKGIIQWGAGGGTDSLMRPLCTLAEDTLGRKINVSNMTGGTGSIAAQYVYDSKADGYTLLLGAENPALYAALNISELTYADFECVLLIGDETVGIVVSGTSPYESFAQLIADALEKPGTITLATTGVGGLPWEVASLIYSVTGASFKQIPYDSDASARTAVLNGECAFTVCKLQTGLEAWKAGSLRWLCVLETQENAALEGVAPITAEYPDFAQFLPWGPFYGVFVKKGTDAKIIDTLSGAFLTAFGSPEYGQVLEAFHINPMGLTGAEAREYISNWADNTIDALRRCGAI